MNEKALHVLEYDKIIDLLAGCATSAPGREACLALRPLSSRPEIERMQGETEAAVSRILKNGNLSFGSAFDVRPSLMRLDVGSSLGMPELLRIAKLLENVSLARAYAHRERDDEAAPDLLEPLFRALDPLPRETAEIRRCILSEDEVSDDASPALRQIRRSIRLAGERIRTELTKIVSSSAKEYLQDALITTRDGRYCIPVKNEYRTQVPGIVHDQSKTGSTVFIEPAAVVRLNNEIRDLHGREAQEIEKILAGLSALLAESSGVIRADYETMCELDFIFARGKLALDQNAARPVVGEDGVIDIRRARHPLIPKKKAVPIDIRLGGDFDLLVVTGPNTGGKTVSLKTTGLLTLMGLSGLHIPAGDRSRISVFREVYADIGDEQSIEQSLSTFSSHMTNVVEFLKSADENSLVLFDELGAGTDPTEGAALALAILDDLRARGIKTMATTHYSEIKVYALRTPRMENASCEFDVETLSPTYRLLIGVPGKSNAFAISRKLGLDEEIIESAHRFIGSEEETFEDVISGLEKQRSELEREKAEIRSARLETEKLRDSLKEKEAALAEKKRNMISDSSEEARRILQEAKDYADKTISWYAKHGGTSREMEQERDRLRKKMNALSYNIKTVAREEAAAGTLTAGDLKIGDAVRVISMGLKGTVSTLPDAKGNLFVNAGIMRTKVKLRDLERIDEPEITSKNMSRTSSGKVRMSKSFAISPEINLLGKTVDEACAELDKYLDDAALSHLEQVRVVHGKGTGALRAGVHKYLKRNRHVSSFRLGEFGEGDSGVTIVKLR
ncbi:MAG: endonuclease MutS2 [Lachnospiraceae bacterium]|nr:endonuclease MutS2 [Lachnospiraceae bacterium]